eukprot:TRINITY_DN51984_c0_g1_i1.p1 TRINITY_DN51984_c0_g1~~TRINITY_DN51984_c0_g1_i1.p1  ORF type:complete len:267 (-),score=67.62 TRINITY_DN51984_c0_g1_i1:315-1115(-)
MGCGKSRSQEATGSEKEEVEEVIEEDPLKLEGDFEINVDSSSSSTGGFGMKVLIPEKHYLVVRSFKPEGGVIPIWNDQQSDPSLQVRIGDWIVEVNGVCGDARKMIYRMQDKDVCMKIKRGDGKLPSPHPALAREPALLQACEESPAQPEVTPPASAADGSPLAQDSDDWLPAASRRVIDSDATDRDAVAKVAVVDMMAEADPALQPQRPVPEKQSMLVTQEVVRAVPAVLMHTASGDICVQSELGENTENQAPADHGACFCSVCS